MRKGLFVLFLTAAGLALPASARADGFVSPHIGFNFGGDTTKDSLNMGVALGSIGGAAGFEFDFGYSPEFYGDEAGVDEGRVVTVMGNLLIGGRHGAFSPYVAGGLGLIRTNVEDLGEVFDIDLVKNSFGGNIGGGVFIGGGALTLRGDVRYFRVFNTDDELEDLLDRRLAFWRGSVGIGLMW